MSRTRARHPREERALSASPSAESAILKRALLEFDRLDALAAQDTPERDRRSFDPKTAKARKRILDVLARELAALDPRSPLGSLVKRFRIDAHRFALLLALSRKRLSTDDPCLTGRQLTTLLFESSYDLLRGGALLSEADALLATGLVAIDGSSDAPPDDPLSRRYRVSERWIRLMQSALAPGGGAPAPSARKPAPYRSNMQLLMDLRRLSLLYRARASLVFRVDSWSELGIASSHTVATVKKSLAALSTRVRERLELTPRAEDFALVSTRREFGLGEDELVVLVTLLFQELREGAAFLDCVDILRLVSESEEDLVRKRRFLGKRSPLVRHNLIAIEEVVADKELTGEAYLPNWVIDRMLGDEDKAAIDADSRIDFHDYLKNLDSSDPFFDDLDDTPA